MQQADTYQSSTTNTVLGKGVRRLPTKRNAGTVSLQQRPPFDSNINTIPTTTKNPGCPRLPRGLPGVQTPIVQEEAGITVTRKEKERYMALAEEEEDRLPTLIIMNNLLTVYSEEEVKQMAVVKVTNDEMSGYGSVNDPRMGVTENDKVCSYCYKDRLSCPGHFGYIELASPIYHPLFMRLIIKVLNCVCNSCGGLLLSPEEIRDRGILRYTGEQRLKELEIASKGVLCRRRHEGQDLRKCTPNPIYLPARIKDTKKIMFKYADQKGAKKEEYVKPIEQVEQILKSISPEEAELMGFSNDSHPSRFIMRVIPVIPPCDRPPVIQEGVIWPDHLTSFYMDIIRHNTLLQQATNEKKRDELLRSMIYVIEHYIDNTDGKYSQGNKKEFLSIKQRIQGKEALIRGALMGKRVNYSGRTVLSPDPSLKFGQIRIPEIMAKYLTVPVTIFSLNQQAMMALLDPKDEQGRDLPSKITHITPGHGKLKGRRIKVDGKIRKEYQLFPGDRVDRWLQNGDYIIFDRQPTLHKQSMMGYEVVLGKPLTIGMHLSYTTPHNADFDGDEGNLHIVQTIEAMTEVREIMNVKNCIMNAQNNKPSMGIVYDALSAAYRLTQPDVVVDIDLYNDCLLLITNRESLPTLDQRLQEFGVPKFSGRSLFSSVLPEDFYYRKGDVIIINGILINGVIKKDHIGVAHGSIIQALWKDYGRDRTVDFLTDAPFILNRWTTENPLTVGLQDCYPEDESYRELLREEITKAKLAVEATGVNRLNDPIEEQRREREIIGYVNVAKSVGSRIATRGLSPNNNLGAMAFSGAKGAEFNIAQITGLLGQQFVQNQRMPLSISQGQRCLAYYEKGDIDPAARGFCVNSFLTGLDPAELFFHQAGGRQGLMDTAVQTSETGSIHHRIIKALEDVKVANDGSVRNTVGTIFQFVYGEDGFDGAELEKIKTKSGETTTFINLARTIGRLNSKYGYYPTEAEPGEKFSVDTEEIEIEHEFIHVEEDFEGGGDE